MTTARRLLTALFLCSGLALASPQQPSDRVPVPVPVPGPATQSPATMIPPAQSSGGALQFGCPDFVEFNVPVPGFTELEPGLLFAPGSTPAGPAERPLLVVYHQFSTSHFAVTNTGFPAEACERGWYVWGAGSRSPIPTARSENYGSVESQVFTKAGLDFVLANYPIDRTRIYGVGFSMGGAQCMAYAARHQNPADGMFAALVNHTGSIDQADTWLSAPSIRSILEQIFGGTPTQAPFAYRSASVIELDPITRLLTNTSTALGNNLTATPTQLWWADQDPWGYLVDQTLAYGDLQAQLQAPHLELHPVASNLHQWDTLPYGEVCDWLEDQVLEIPNEGRVVADRDERWLYFDLAGIAPQIFASFDYRFDFDNDWVEFLNCDGFAELETNLTDWNGGQPQSLPLDVNINLTTGGVRFVLNDVADLPVSVLRDGLPQAIDWSYDPVSQTLEIVEMLAGTHTWTLLP